MLLSASVVSTQPGLEGISLQDANIEQDSSDPGDIIAYCVGKKWLLILREKEENAPTPNKLPKQLCPEFDWNVFFPFALQAVPIPSLFYPCYQGKPKSESTVPSSLWDMLLLELLIFLGHSKDIVHPFHFFSTWYILRNCWRK